MWQIVFSASFKRDMAGRTLQIFKQSMLSGADQNCDRLDFYCVADEIYKKKTFLPCFSRTLPNRTDIPSTTPIQRHYSCESNCINAHLVFFSPSGKSVIFCDFDNSVQTCRLS